MPQLAPNLSAAERIILAIDTSDEDKAEELVKTARQAGAWVVKIGLEYSAATSWKNSADLAGEYGLSWVADAKLHDIPNTVAGAVNNLSELDSPPVGITIHTKSGINSLRKAQEIAKNAEILMLGVTHLTSIDESETLDYEEKTAKEVVRGESVRAVAGSIGGLVCSAQEVAIVKSAHMTRHLITMIPGTRSSGEDTSDQTRVMTPAEAIKEGADFLVIGRQISGAPDPAEAFEQVRQEIEVALGSKEGERAFIYGD